MRYILLIALLFSLCHVSDAQNKSERFLGLKLQGGDVFRVRANSYGGSSPTFENEQNHTVAAEAGYGWFYQNNKSLYIGLTSSLGHSGYSGNKFWNNSFGFTIQKVNYKNLYQDKLYFSLAQDLYYSYAYSRAYQTGGSAPRRNPQTTAHMIDFSVKPGVFFRYSKSIAFVTQLRMLGVQLSMNEIAGATKATHFNYDIFSDYTFANIQVGLIWFPSAISKVNP
jgi:hypothetical protein